MQIPVSELPVMTANCKSCPFKEDEHGRQLDTELTSQITVRTLFNAQQICHSTESKNRKPNHRCKGSYDTNKAIYDRLGFGHLLK